MRFDARIAKLSAVACLLVLFLIGRKCRADDPLTEWVSLDGTHGNDDSFVWAQCNPDGQDGYCTPGDLVYYQFDHAPNVNIAEVTVDPASAPSGWPATSVASGEVRWCSVAIQCHIGGGISEWLYDEEEGDTGCHVDCADVGTNLADYIWATVGVSQYPP